MTFGAPNARWGRVAWGDQTIDEPMAAAVDGLAAAVDYDLTASVDAVTMVPDADLVASVDGLAQATEDISAAVDCYTAPLLPAWRDRVTSPLILIEMRLPGGTVRVAGRDVLVGGLTWDGRLIESGRILRTIAEGSEDLSIEVDDTATRGPRFRDIFLANAPEGSGLSVFFGLLGDDATRLLHVWEGSIDRIPGISRATARIEALRTEHAVDRLLGTAVTIADFPGAPPSSVGRMLPLVWGTVAQHEGVVVDTLGVGVLAANVLGRDTEIPLQDASAFPSSGQVLIGSERIAYSGKQGNTLTGCARGIGLAIFSVRLSFAARPTYPKGTTVAEVGNFDVRLASHALARIENVRILDSNGELGEPVPGPSLITASIGLLRWGQVPRIRPAHPVSAYTRVHFNAAGATNAATNPQRAARSAPGYDAMGFASLGTGPLVLVTDSEGLGEPGDIVSVWLGVIFDPDTLGAGANVRFPGPTTGPSYALVAADSVPDEIARNDERTGDRIYEVNDPGFTVVQPTEEARITPNEIIDPGMWKFASPGNIVDGNDDTYSVNALISAGEVTIGGAGVFRARVAPPPDYSGATITTAKLVFVAGWERVPFTSPMKASIAKDDGTGVFRPIAATVVLASTLGPSGLPLGQIKGVETFETSFDPLLLGALGHLEDLGACEFQIAPTIGVSQGIWAAHEIRLEVTVQRTSPTTKANIDPNRTVTNYFEITRTTARRGFGGFGLRSLSIAAATAQDWAFFSDAARGGQVSIVANGSDAVRIVDVFWVVKFAPFEDVSTGVPRVFADVAGRIPGGNPVDVCASILTEATPDGLGLTVDSIDTRSAIAARASTLADGLRVDFALRERTSAIALLREVAEQADCRQRWDLGRHAISRRPAPDTALPVVLTLTEAEVWKNSMSASRSTLGEVRSRVQGLYAPSQVTGVFMGAKEVLNLVSEAAFGRRDEQVSLSLVRDDAAALIVLTRRLARIAAPRWELTFQLPLLGLELRPGDIVALVHPDFSAAVCEATDLDIDTGGDSILIGAKATVWMQA